MPDFIPRKDSDLLAWAKTFVAALQREPAAFGLTGADVVHVSETLSTFSGAVPTAYRAQMAAKAAVTAKNVARHEIEAEIRSLVRRVNAKRSVPDGLKRAAGISTGTRAHRSTQPQQPQGFSAAPQIGGTILLKWSGKGNRAGTVYVIEMWSESTGGWRILDVETRTRHTYKGLSNRERIVFRVSAKRSGVVSEPSNTAEVYGDAPALAA